MSAYEAWLEGALVRVEQQLTTLVESAERAAHSADLPCFLGSPLLRAEAYGRSGGLMGLDWDAHLKRAYTGTIVYFREGGDRGEVARLRGRRFPTLVVGRSDSDVDSGARPVGLPTEPLAAMVVLWTWTAEYVAACTRRGKMPVMWQSGQAPGAWRRVAYFRGKSFHAYRPHPVPAERLGRQYLDRLRLNLERQSRLPWAAAAELARPCPRRHAFLFGHAIYHALGGSDDPGLLANITAGWDRAHWDRVQAGDFLLVLYSRQIPDWAATRARRAGARIVWSSAVGEAGPGEIHLAQGWDLADAEVSLSDYDVPILPVSGILANLHLWRLQEEMLRHV